MLRIQAKCTATFLSNHIRGITPTGCCVELPYAWFRDKLRTPVFDAIGSLSIMTDLAKTYSGLWPSNISITQVITGNRWGSAIGLSNLYWKSWNNKPCLQTHHSCDQWKIPQRKRGFCRKSFHYAPNPYPQQRLSEQWHP